MLSPIRAIRRLKAKIREARANHAVRHRPTGYRFAVADDIRFLNAADWDAAARNGGFFLTRKYLEVLAGHAPENVSPRCALIYDGEIPVAAIAAQVVELAGKRMVRPSTPAKAKSLLKGALTPIAKKAATMIRERVLVCGNLLSWGQHGVAFAPGADPAALWPAVAEALYRIRRGEKLLGDAALLVIKDLDASQMPAATVLRQFSYRPLETDPNMLLEIRPGWRNFDDYLASLDGKYRKSARQLIATANDAGVTFEPLTDLVAVQDSLHALYLQVHQAAAVQPVTLRPTYLPALSQTAADGFRCTVAKKDGAITGFVTSVKDGDTAVGYYIGYDRALAAAGVPLYLRLLHSTVEHAIALGCRRLSLGRTALEPKSRLGAKPVPLHLWTRHRVPALNWLLRAILQSVPHDEAPERNPFKAG